MGLRPTRGNENQRRPREGGDPFQVDSRFRGNDPCGRDFQERRVGVRGYFHGLQGVGQPSGMSDFCGFAPLRALRL